MHVKLCLKMIYHQQNGVKLKNVLFIVDHKHRDLAASSLIGYYLKEDGYSVAYCATWHESDMVKEFSPERIL